MCESHRYSHQTPEPHVNRFPAAENGDDEDDDDEEEEERRHDEEEEEEEEPIWTASGALIGTSRFPFVRPPFPAGAAEDQRREPNRCWATIRQIFSCGCTTP